MFKNMLSAFANRKYDLLFIGELLVDEIRDSDNTLFLTFGGSPSNIALNVKQLGLNPLLVAAIGNDEESKYLKHTLDKYLVNTDLLQNVDTVTSKVALSDNIETPKPIFNRFSDYQIQYTNDLDKALDDIKILHVSYWPLTKEPSKSTVLKAMKKAKENNVLIAFDPNIHKDLKTDETISHETLLGLLKDVDIIKPSLDDAARLFGEGYSKEQYMDFFEAAGIPLILMTLGKDGVYVSDQGKRQTFNALPIDVLDATGAGDAFWSGFYAGLLNGLSLKKTIGFAQAVSSIVLQSIGAITELPSFDKINQRSRQYENTFSKSSR